MAWFEQYGVGQGDYGVAETLSKAKNTSVAGLVEAGVLEARLGKVRLLLREELPVDWDPATDWRPTVWESAQHPIRALDTQGKAGAAALLRKVGGGGEAARDLAYWLYSILIDSEEEDMGRTEQLRQDLRAVIAQAEAGNTDEVVRTAQRVLEELDGERLLTTTEAAAALGVRSINTVKLWCRNGFLASVQRGNRTMIPLAEIERVRDSDRVLAIRAADTLHEASADFGVPEGLSAGEMEQLSAARPGRLPWQR